MPGSPVCCTFSGADGFLAEIGLVPAGEIGGMGRLGRRHCIAVAAAVDGVSGLTQHMEVVCRIEYIYSTSGQALEALAPRKIWVTEA